MSYTDEEIDRSQRAIGEILDAGTEIAPIEIKSENALAVFSGSFHDTIMPLLVPIRRAVENFTALAPDVRTEEGRQKVRSFAYKLARSKTTLDDAGKRVNDELKRIPKLVDANRKTAREMIEGWQEDVTKPLVAWETKEEERKWRHVNAIENIKILGSPVSPAVNSADLREYMAKVQAIHAAVADKEEFAEEYDLALNASVARLEAAIVAAEANEAQAKEIVRLRAIQAEQEARAKAEFEAQRQRERQQQMELAEARRIAAEREREAAEANARAKAAIEEAERQVIEAHRAAKEREAAEAAKAEAAARAAASFDEAKAAALAALTEYFPNRHPSLPEGLLSDIIDGNIPHIKFEI